MCDDIDEPASEMMSCASTLDYSTRDEAITPVKSVAVASTPVKSSAPRKKVNIFLNAPPSQMRCQRLLTMVSIAMCSWMLLRRLLYLRLQLTQIAQMATSILGMIFSEG